MPKVVVRNFACSLDGFGAGLHQSQAEPFGKNAFQIMNWFLPTRTFKSMVGGEGGDTGLDDSYAAKAFEGVGASIMGRNMFSPLRGPWADEDWKGWWGDNPPYHTDTYVVSHHAREPLPMEGGTTFYFVTEGIEEALRRAKESAGEKDVRIGGGANLVNQYLAAGLIDEIETHVVPVLIGSGQRLFNGLGRDFKLEKIRAVEGEKVTHIKYRVLK